MSFFMKNDSSIATIKIYNLIDWRYTLRAQNCFRWTAIFDIFLYGDTYIYTYAFKGIYIYISNSQNCLVIGLHCAFILTYIHIFFILSSFSKCIYNLQSDTLPLEVAQIQQILQMSRKMSPATFLTFSCPIQMHREWWKRQRPSQPE